MDVLHLVKKLKNLYRTNDPFRIAQSKNITVVFEYLGRSTWGYFSNVNRIPIIHLHEELDDMNARFTCAHELGHSLMHPRVNTPFLKKNTLQSIDRIEREANQFAVELLMTDELLLEGMSIYEAATSCGVPVEVAHLKTRPSF
ncbi:ImmA/IrrE family metallo-endopeptidase [Paenibacillus oleatilyticus]|uniref:ImmA/IrrE family metallo-endopeptidase n=1 Tax=Paenibacillus oleatilyticus TaxID=2594886 RepID=A0ABV4UT48_9BACL